MSDVIKVFIIDDHLVVREGISSILDYEKDIKVIGQASNATEALSKIETLSPNIILMDLRMPGVDGIKLTKMIMNVKPTSKIIILTLYDQFVDEGISAGARGYLLKDISRELLVEAIRKVNSGETVYDKQVTPSVNIEYEDLSDDDTVIGGESNNQENDPTLNILYNQIRLFIIPPVNIGESLKITSSAEEALSADFKQVEGTPGDGISVTFNLYSSTPTKEVVGKLSKISFIKVLGNKELDTLDELKNIIRLKKDYDLKHPLTKTIFIKMNVIA